MSVAKHVVPRPNGEWAVRSTGASRAVRVFDNQADAVQFGRSVAKKDRTELYVHRKDGTILERNSYGSLPLTPKG